MKKNRILVTGSTGFVGQAVLRYLLKRGHTVTCLLRPDSDEASLAGLKIDKIRVDPFDIENLKESIESVRDIVHIGGLTKANREEEYMRANVDYTYNLTLAFKESKAKERFIYVSSQAAFGGSPKNRAGNEEDPAKPIFAYGRSKLMAEDKLKEFTQFFKVWILRTPSIYGPGDKGLFGMWENIQKNRPTRTHWDYPMSMLYVLDLCSIISKIVQNSFDGQEKRWNLYFITDGEEHSFKEICETAAKILNKKAYYIQGIERRVILKGLIKSFLGLISKRFDKDAWKLHRKYAFNISCDKAKRELGYTPEYPLKKGLELTLTWYKKNGWL